MKKLLCSAIAVFLIVSALSACVPAADGVSPDPSPAPSSDPIMEPSVAPPVIETLNIENELPLDEQSLSIAVPDFLDEEQQLLYRKAYRLYDAMFGGSSSGIELPRTSEQPALPSLGYDSVMYAGKEYIVSTGRYSDWNDFTAVIYSVFTSTFWDSVNQADGAERYINADGRMCYLDLGQGSGRLYLGQPDEFELGSRTDDSITFTLIGHYRQAAEDGGDGSGYTIRFPMKMLKTADGWRFDEFHSAFWEQRLPTE